MPQLLVDEADVRGLNRSEAGFAELEHKVHAASVPAGALTRRDDTAGPTVIEILPQIGIERGPPPASHLLAPIVWPARCLEVAYQLLRSLWRVGQATSVRQIIIARIGCSSAINSSSWLAGPELSDCRRPAYADDPARMPPQSSR